ncbi:hypothetical protein CALCODRAFT_485052 [Calocera cornea HHB12733]|uniref:N-acetyltransferase domain-containing protein n=1 Tax=Calocera cornea HHB12733 TaxID=1353952 RepID=A0A165ELQ2_9BASI|nr:hypothetical protein CALCODRAFT_485052 [Calocera cornea HHB12733]
MSYTELNEPARGRIPRSDVRFHIRRLVDPSEGELAGILRVMRVALVRDPCFRLILQDNCSPSRLDALNRGLLRAALLEGEGELWVAEVERPESKGLREIVGQVVWYLPGNKVMNHDLESPNTWWNELMPLLSAMERDWLLRYFLPRLAGIWERCLPIAGDTVDDGYYCQLLSVLPEFHNCGIMFSVIAPVIFRAIREGKRILFESTSEENVRKYEHIGSRVFGVEDFLPLPESGMEVVKLWPFELLHEAVLGENSYWKKEKEEGVLPLVSYNQLGEQESTKQSNGRIHIRRLIGPSERGRSGVLQVMRLAFARDPFVTAIVGGDASPVRLDALNRGIIRTALREGELWVAEVERPEANGVREIVGVAIWYVPREQGVSDDLPTSELWWDELVPLLSDQQKNWLLNYLLPRFAILWDSYLPIPGATMDDEYYCRILSVLPEFHNRGIVSALSGPIIKRAVREGKRILGEATSAENLSKYEHIGGKIFGVEQFRTLPETGVESVRLWPFEVVPQVFVRNLHWTRTKKEDSRSELAKL